jgi:DNA-binding winged helix-turn-helix (wHTH) protein/tetratricopeptide (TPR) repeat protein
MDGEVDLREAVVRRASVVHRLTTREHDLLRYLAPRSHRAVPRDELMREVWGYSDSARSRAVDFTVHRLRAKLEADPSEPRHLLTVYGLGFRLAPAVDVEGGPPAGWIALLAARHVHGSAEPAAGLAVSERLVAAVAARGGHPARADGIRWLAAFSSTDDALSCAEDLLADPEIPVSLGWGLATGVAHPVREPMTGHADYRDACADRALALAAAAPPGVVLLDPASADALPVERSPQPIGAYAVGTGGPVELWAWGAGEGPVVPRAAAVGRTNLPRDLDAFVGRTGALDALGEALGEPVVRPAPHGRTPNSITTALAPGSSGRDGESEHPADCAVASTRTRRAQSVPVAITGPGGIGKSRLAREIGRAEVERGREVRLCSLARARTAADVVRAVRGALGLDGGGDVGQALAWRGRPLLVLDEAEGCIGPVGEQVALWRGAAPEARFVVTSRVRPSGPGWRIHALGPLPTAEGIALLIERARRVRPDFGADPVEQARIAELVDAVGGWPLALEIVAARAAIATVEELVAEVSAGADALEATVARSVDALGARQLRALVRLSVPPGGFDLGLAEALIGPDAPEVLAALVSASLVSERVEGAGLRFSLAPPIAACLDRRPAAEDRREAEDAMARWLLARFGPEPEPPATAAEAAALQREEENLLAVVRATGDPEVRARAVLALSIPWRASAPPDTLRALLDEAIADPPPGDERRAQLLLVRGHTRMLAGDLAGARADFTAVPADGGRLEGRALLGLGNLGRLEGDLDAAEAAFQRAVGLRQALGDVGAEGVLLGCLGAVAGERGDVIGSEALLHRSLDRLHEAGWRAMEAPMWSMLAVARTHQRRWDDALLAARRALQRHREHGDRRGEAMSLLRLDQIRRFGGHPSGQDGDRAVAVARAIGDGRIVAGVQSFRGASAVADGRHDDAEALLTEALSLDPDPSNRAYCEVLSALSDLERGRIDAARARVAVAAALTPPGHRLSAYRWCVEAVLERAPSLARQARAQLAEEPDGVALAHHAEVLAALLVDPGDPQAVAAAEALLGEEPPPDLAFKMALYRRLLRKTLRQDAG